jgi:ABC-type multidrug transport system ATPase subunit
MSIVKVNNLSKSYGKTEALKDISFEVKPGELFGFIGPDGAGKTTLLRILTSLIIPDKGTAEVLGYDVEKEYRKIRSSVGYMPGRFSLYQDLSVEENLKFFATIFGTTLEENYNLIKNIYIYLEPFKKRKAGKLSGGMKQKLALCCALIHKPDLLILDEPTTGVDPVSRDEFWEMLGGLKAEGITTVVSTPYMDEAKLCDRVALIQKANILGIDKPSELIKRNYRKMYAIKSDNMYGLIKSLNEFENIDSVNIFGEYIHFTFKEGDENMDALKKYLSEKEIMGIEYKEIKPDIEDIFIELMRKK